MSHIAFKTNSEKESLVNRDYSQCLLWSRTHSALHSEGCDWNPVWALWRSKMGLGESASCCRGPCRGVFSEYLRPSWNRRVHDGKAVKHLLNCRACQTQHDYRVNSAGWPDSHAPIPLSCRDKQAWRSLNFTLTIKACKISNSLLLFNGMLQLWACSPF